VSATSPLLEEVRGLLQTASSTYAGTESGERLDDVLARLDEPLRVAIAGKVKAGKSTLLNALVGEELAPTDEGECTKIITWYRDGQTYKVELYPHDDGEPRQVPFARDEGAIEVDIGDTTADEVERLVVDWPSSSLKRITLIDTPGIASLSEDVSARTKNYLTPDDDKETAADAVLYLMKHLHATDVNFLEAFHDEEASQATPVNAIAVLSRADEVAVGRLDAMDSARSIAARYSTDPKVRRLAQTVLPVAGLLAQTGATIREAEFKALSAIASAPEDETDKLFLSADRFINATTQIPLTSDEREAILGRLGVFGLRLAIQLLRSGEVTTSGQLSERLVAESGLVELRAALLAQFADRRDVLKARSGLLALEAAAHADPAKGAELMAELERITASAHEFNEIRLLNALRTGSVEGKPEDLATIERMLGTGGTSAAARLGLDAGADAGAIGQAAQEALQKWQMRAESPMASKEMVDAARVLIRTCEGILTELSRA
jgi:predicted GTPase